MNFEMIKGATLLIQSPRREGALKAGRKQNMNASSAKYPYTPKDVSDFIMRSDCLFCLIQLFSLKFFLFRLKE